MRKRPVDTLRLALVQYSPVFGDKPANFAALEVLSAGIDADIIIFPELCTTGYYFRSREEVAGVAESTKGETAHFFREMAVRHNAIVVAGFAETADGGLYNSALIVRPGDDKTHVYRKIHLFYKEIECFDVGNTGYFVLRDDERDLNLGTMVCYDWRFPEAARTLTVLGADLIACPSNLVTDAWRLVMPARAIENKVYLAVANRAGTEKRGDEELLFKGNSAIYSYNGQELAKAPAEGDTVLYADIHAAETRDKSFNAINDVLRDRQPEYYTPLTAPRR